MKFTFIVFGIVILLFSAVSISGYSNATEYADSRNQLLDNSNHINILNDHVHSQTNPLVSCGRCQKKSFKYDFPCYQCDKCGFRVHPGCTGKGNGYKCDDCDFGHLKYNKQKQP